MLNFHYKLSFLALIIISTISPTIAADIIIHSTSDSNHIIVDSGAFKLSEQQVTETVATILSNALLQRSDYSYTIASNSPALAQLDAHAEENGCRILAIELHFNPSDQPSGRGSGLWVATDKADAQANAIAQAFLDTWSSKKHSPYQGVPLHHKQPKQYLSNEHGVTTCPSLYLNLDTFTETRAYSWFSQPQAIYYYANDLAHAILTALNNQ